MKTILGAAAIGLIFGLLVMQGVEVETQLAMLGVIERIAPVVFGILGVWIAVLDPTVILKHVPSQVPNAREKLALQFSPLLLDATIVFIGVVTLRFIEPTFSREWLSLWWAKGLLGSVITFFYIFEMTILIRTLQPVFTSMKQARINESRRNRY